MVKVQVGITDCSKQVEKGVEKAVSRAKHLENQAESVRVKNEELEKECVRWCGMRRRMEETRKRQDRLEKRMVGLMEVEVVRAFH